MSTAQPGTRGEDSSEGRGGEDDAPVEAQPSEWEGGPLVVVSNRLPVTVRRTRGGIRTDRSSGGLVAAMDPVMRRRGGTWVGWLGAHLRANEELPPVPLPYELAPVPLSATDVRRYYHGFSNRAIWPLFHSMPERTELDIRDWKVYETVNLRFADATARAAEEAELIWIHDYHLMRAPVHLRRLRPDARLAFFLHIPFPPYDIYRILPWYRDVLRGLLACDLVGFHSPGYVSNFLDCAERLLGSRVDREAGVIEHGNRAIQVASFPLGIDYELFESRARDSRRSLRAAGERAAGDRIVLGVDRLDYTKGIPERIRAFEKMLEQHKQMRGKAVLLQVAVPSRDTVGEYQSLKRQIDELVGRVNGRFGTSAWTPIRYIHRSINAERLCAMYRDADVALVTPLRDGMNLVAKEFVACQVDDPGVLVLSRMAGAAETMREAVLVNPYNVDGVAESLYQALTMAHPEREERVRALQSREREHDLYRWLNDFLLAAGRPAATVRPFSSGDFSGWLGRFLARRPLALFLDYDGTLVELVDHPSKAALAPRVRKLLELCAAREDTDVTIVSGRSLADVRAMVGLEGVAYAGNHGIEIAGPGLVPFMHRDALHFSERAEELEKRLGAIHEPGVWVEAKGASLTLHYRNADPAAHDRIAELARSMIAEIGFQARDAHAAVEGRPPIGWDKGNAVLHVLRSRYGPAWSESRRVVYAGDDETDEDAFRSLKGLGLGFRVGDATRATRASHRLPNTNAVHALLEWLAARPAV